MSLKIDSLQETLIVDYTEDTNWVKNTTKNIETTDDCESIEVDEASIEDSEEKSMDGDADEEIDLEKFEQFDETFVQDDDYDLADGFVVADNDEQALMENVKEEPTVLLLDRAARVMRFDDVYEGDDWNSEDDTDSEFSVENCEEDSELDIESVAESDDSDAE